jgi:hypothetical protein
MIIITSLSPNHSNAANQQAAIDSWQPYGKCYSMNTAGEVSGFNNIEIIATDKTVNGIVGKRLININAMIDFAIQNNEDLLIMNSDIILTGLPMLHQDGITIISRHDYTDDVNLSRVFNAGFDVFFIPKQLLTMFPPSIYAMGAAWWDYWIPYRAILSGIPVYWPLAKYAYHKLHATQYSQDEWVYIGEYFRWEFKLHSKLTIGQIATNTLLKIQSRAKRI